VNTPVPTVAIRLTDSLGVPVVSERIEVRYVPLPTSVTQRQVELCSGPVAVVRFGLDTALVADPVFGRTDASGLVTLRVQRGCRAQDVSLEFFSPRLLLRDTIRFQTRPGRATGFEVRARRPVLAVGELDTTLVSFLDRFENALDAGVALAADTGVTVSGRSVTASAVGTWQVRAAATVNGTLRQDTAAYLVVPAGSIALLGRDTLVGRSTTFSVAIGARRQLSAVPMQEFRPQVVVGSQRVLFAVQDTGSNANGTFAIRVRSSNSGNSLDLEFFRIGQVVPQFFGTGALTTTGEQRFFLVRNTGTGNRLVSLDFQGREVRSLPTAFPVRTIAVSPDGERVAQGPDRTASDSVVQVRSFETGAVLSSARGVDAAAMQWSLNGERIVVLGSDGRYVGLEAATGARYGRCGIDGSTNFSASPDGRHVAWLVAHVLSYCDLITGRTTQLGCIVAASRCGTDGPTLLWRPDP
jgi:hypothetical protein